jgi:hypothetical protein
MGARATRIVPVLAHELILLPFAPATDVGQFGDLLFFPNGEPMAELISYCGMNCQTCPIYVATRAESKEEQARMRAEIARQCQVCYGLKYEAEDIIDCDGCRTDEGRLFWGSRDCRIRKCAREKGLENCAHCADYACSDLRILFAKEPAAKARLDETRRAIQ